MLLSRGNYPYYNFLILLIFFLVDKAKSPRSLAVDSFFWLFFKALGMFGREGFPSIFNLAWLRIKLLRSSVLPSIDFFLSGPDCFICIGGAIYIGSACSLGSIVLDNPKRDISLLKCNIRSITLFFLCCSI